MVHLGIGLSTQFVVYHVVEVFNIGKENAILLFLNMVETAAMAHHARIVLAGKPNAQVASESFVFIRKNLPSLSSPSENLDYFDQAKIRKKKEI